MLYLSCDPDSLSPYQVLIREQVEFFEALPCDLDLNAQGRNKPIVIGQVGIRCRYCAGLQQRTKGAVYYPAKLLSIYQAAQNLAANHLCETCPMIPGDIRAEMCRLRDAKVPGKGGKEHWARAAGAFVVYEDEYGLRYERR